MPSQLVDEVRALIRAREEAGQPLTSLERTFIMAAVVPRRNMPDLVDELEAAQVEARAILLSNPPKTLDPAVVDSTRKRVTRRLLAAGRAILDHDPAREPIDPAAAAPDERARPERADVDG